MLKSQSTFLILIFLGLFFIGPSLFAQTADDAPIIEEDHDTKNLDKLLINYNKDQEKVLKDAAQIQSTDEAGEFTDKELGTLNPTVNNPATNTKKKIDPNTLKKMKYSDALRVALEPLQKMSEKELVKLLRDNTKGSKTEMYLDRFPKFAVFTVRLIKDKDALPNIAKILDDQERLINFVGVLLFTTLIAFFLKRLMKREGRSIAKALSLWFLRFLIVSFLRFWILYSFYSTELTPTLNIASKTFF